MRLIDGIPHVAIGDLPSPPDPHLRGLLRELWPHALVISGTVWMPMAECGSHEEMVIRQAQLSRLIQNNQKT